MKLSKEIIKGYCQALIDTNEGINSDLDVQANVYYIELSNSYEVSIHWFSAYDNCKDEDIRDNKEFKIVNLKDFGFELIKFLDDVLSNVIIDLEYDSRQTLKEYEDEMRFEYSRGN